MPIIHDMLTIVFVDYFEKIVIQSLEYKAKITFRIKSYFTLIYYRK